MAATEKVRLLRRRAAAAAATLLGGVPGAQAAKGAMPPAVTQDSPHPVSSPDHWTWDTSFMQYTETQRIAVSEPQIGVRRDFGDGRALSILATVDTISGATPLGTLPATQNTAPNTITNASGHLYSPVVGIVPTEHMSDTRIGLSSSYERPVGQSMSGVFGGEVAKEHDFLSLGANGMLNRDYNQKNTTLSFGLSPEFDVVTPNGGLPLAYGTQLSPNEFQGTSKTKYLVGGLIGVTQVISRDTLMQFNYSPTYENGYLNDPYKLLSLVNAGAIL